MRLKIFHILIWLAVVAIVCALFWDNDQKIIEHNGMNSVTWPRQFWN